MLRVHARRYAPATILTNVTLAGSHQGPRPGSPGAMLHSWLLADAAFILADIFQRQGILTHVGFLVSEERGFAELFQYGKTGFGILLLTLLAARRASLSALMWALVLMLVLLDDSLALHEQGGVYLERAMGLRSFGPLRANQIGEVIAFAGLAVCCLTAVAIGWRHADGEDRRLTRTLLVWFSALAFCAVVLDAVASFTRRSRFGGGVAALEDGGEMIVMSFLVMSVWATLRPPAPVGPALRAGDVP